MDKSTTQHQSTKGLENAQPNASTSGLDQQGQFRIGEKITLGVRGDKLLLREAHSGREVEVEEGEVQGLLHDTYFVDKK